MKRHYMILATSFLSFAAMAAQPAEMLTTAEALLAPPPPPQQGPGNPGGFKPENPCIKLNLSEEQKVAIKEIMYQAAQTGIQDQADIKKGLLVAEHTLSSAKSTRAEGEAAATAALNAFGNAGKNFVGVELAVIYDVLQADQRASAIQCAKFMRARHGKPGNGHGPGGGPGHGPGQGPGHGAPGKP